MKKIFNLENLIYLTVFALPAYLLRFRVFLPSGGASFSSNALDCLLVLCVALWLIYHRREPDYRLFFKQHSAIIFFTGLIFLGLTSSVLLNGNLVAGAGIIKSWFLLPIAFVLIASSVVGKERLKNIFLAYYASAFFVALVCLGYDFFGQVTFDGRLEGFFNSPNYLAMYLAPAVFIGYGLRRELGGHKWLVAISGGSILLALYWTFSYASWFSILVALGIVFALEKKLSGKKVLLCLFLLVAIFFSQRETVKFSDLVNLHSRSSFSSRIMIWQSAEKMLTQNWIFGIGAGNFQTKYLEDQKYFPPYLEWAVPHPHSLYLAFWLYGGLAGMVGFFGLIYFWFLAIFRSQKNSQLKLIGLGIMCYILFHGLVDTTYFKNDLAVVFWLLFTVI